MLVRSYALILIYIKKRAGIMRVLPECCSSQELLRGDEIVQVGVGFTLRCLDTLGVQTVNLA